NYGKSLALGMLRADANLVLQHSITLNGLSASTLYYYNVTSCDIAGNCNTTGPFNFTTLAGGGGGGGGGAGGGGAGGGAGGRAGGGAAGGAGGGFGGVSEASQTEKGSTFDISQELETNLFSKVEVKAKDKIIFKLKAEQHTVFIESIGSNFIEVAVKSNEIRKKIYLDETVSFDIDADNKADFSLTLERIIDRKAVIKLELLCDCPQCSAWSACVNGTTSRECYRCVLGECQAFNETISCQVPKQIKAAKLLKLFLVLGVIISIILALIVIGIMRLLREEKREGRKEERGEEKKEEKSRQKIFEKAQIEGT
ncbi:MAG: fibronectin type III domain-containing protein, partial [Candidatus Pacearchaeota archaeon]